MIKNLHSVGTWLLGITSHTVTLAWCKCDPRVLILRLCSVFQILGWTISSLHWRAWQYLVTLFKGVTDCTARLLEAIPIKWSGPALLRISIRLALNGINLISERSLSILSVIDGSYPSLGPLWKVASVCCALILLCILRVRCSHVASLSIPSTCRCAFGWLGCHGRICHIACFLLQRLMVGLHHCHACIGGLHHVVVLDGSEVEKRFFLNCLCRVLRLLDIVSFAWVWLLHFSFWLVSGVRLFNKRRGYVLRSWCVLIMHTISDLLSETSLKSAELKSRG